MIQLTAETLRFAYLVLFALEFICLRLLTLLNLRALAAGRQPPELKMQIGADILERSRLYARANSRLSLAASTLNAGVLLFLLLSGALGRLEAVSRLPSLPGELQSLLPLVTLYLLFGLISLPFSVWRQFGIEARFGFNTMKPRLFLLDLFRQGCLTALLGSALLLALLRLINRGGSAWWLYAFLLLAGAQIALMVLVPLVIAPLFNTFSPLPAGELKKRIRAFMASRGLRLSGVFVMDGSRRSKHANAYFSGLGRTRRVVLFDTLLKNLPDEQILAVLAHELGHQKLRHLLKSLALALPGLLAALWLAGQALHLPALFSAFGFSAPGPAALLVLALFYSQPLFFFLKPLASGLSRRRELAADRFALDAGISPAVLSAALLKLSIDNLIVLSPHRLYSLYHNTHPPLSERLRAIAATAEKPPPISSPAA
jgi:STE24 endopeptidase